MKRSFSLLPAILLSLLLFSSCYFTGERVTGDGNFVKKERPAEDFSRLTVLGPMNVFIRQGPSQPASIEADANLIPYVETVKEGDKMVVRFKDHVSVSSRNPINVYLTSPSVVSISLLGSGDITGEDTLANGNGMELSMAGSGNIKLQLNTPDVKASVAGSGDIIVSGYTRDMNVNIAGSGDFKAEQLLSENAHVNIAGSGDAYVYASVSLDANILGSGNVTYHGDAKASSHTVGSGELIRK